MADQYVYVKHKEFHWIPGILVETTKTKATVSIAQYENESEITGDNNNSNNSHGGRKMTNITVYLKDYPNQALPLQNITDGRVKNVRDMIELSFLHEAAILYNLKARHIKHDPYTRTGDIVIAVNPYQWFPKLYTEENRTNYSRALVWEAGKKDYDPRQDLPPHVYETSALAYKGLSVEGIEQSILVSGESGAGKTETVKICMNHLASVVQQEHDADGDNKTQDQDVIKRVLDSNPLLEAFGNAKTRRNDNSSRFGKFVSLQFIRANHHNPTHLTLVGSICEVYLLEKSRVVSHDIEERTFHIFYQLIAASDEIKTKFWSKLEGTTYADFSYVGDTDTTVIEGVSDHDKFQQTLESLSIIGIKGPILHTFMTAICVVLQSGNIIFGPAPHDSDHSIVSSSGELQALADLMDIPMDNLRTTLTVRAVKVRGEVTMVPLNPEAAKDSINALAKQIYDRIFLWLVKQINAATTGKTSDSQKIEHIGLLDIFGFESFQVNSFEQLCINYANEQLQQKFTKDVFVSVFEEYKEEGISLDEITYDDNTHVLDLIQNRTGLLAMLNEECVRPGGSDYGFVNKGMAANKSSPALIIPRIVHSDVEFGIRHYAGDVMYDATDFVTKNQDTLPTDLMECAGTSTNDIIAKELTAGSLNKTSTPSSNRSNSRMPSRSKKSNLVAPTAWTKYKEQLTRLMKDLHKSESRYIRCVKPNSLKKPKIMEHGMTLQQLRSSGVVAAVTLARSAFPNRLEHNLVLDRFFPLWPPSIPRKNEAQYNEQCETLLSYALKPLEKNGVNAFVIGRTRSYFRAGALEYLEASRLKGMEGPATVVQSIVRGYLARRLAYRIKHKAELEWLAQQGDSAIVIQCVIRSFLARKERSNRYVDYMKHQAKLKKREKKLKKLGIAAIKIQKVQRGVYIRKHYKPVVEKAQERYKLREKVNKLEKKIAKAKKHSKKELEKAEKGVDVATGREAWEASILEGGSSSEATGVPMSATAQKVEVLQSEFRRLQIKTKTMDGMLKPLKKNFATLMEENKQLREEFAEIHKKNEGLKKKNKELTDRREAAEKKVKSLKQELKSSAGKFTSVTLHERLDYNVALREIMTILKKKCKEKQLVQDATLIAKDCEAAEDAAIAAAEQKLEELAAASPKKSPRRRVPSKARSVPASRAAQQRLGASLSNLDDTSERLVASMNNSFSGGLFSPKSAGATSKKNRRSVQSSLGNIDSLISPGVHRSKGKVRASSVKK